MFLSSICKDVVVDVHDRERDGERSASSASNWRAVMDPVASSIRIWSTASSISSPGTSEPPTRCASSSFRASVRGSALNARLPLAVEARRLALAAALDARRPGGSRPTPRASTKPSAPARGRLSSADTASSHRIPATAFARDGSDSCSPARRSGDGAELGTVFTTLIAERKPTVSRRAHPDARTH